MTDQMIAEIREYLLDVVMPLIGSEAQRSGFAFVWANSRLTINAPAQVAGLMIGSNGTMAQAIRTLAKSRARSLGYGGAFDVRIERGPVARA